MARSKRSNDLFDKLHASGVRKRVARLIADGMDGRKRPAKNVRGAVDDLRAVIAQIEDRAKGGPSKRSAAAKKAVATRKRNAARRSAAAKKAARTRARS